MYNGLIMGVCESKQAQAQIATTVEETTVQLKETSFEGLSNASRTKMSNMITEVLDRVNNDDKEFVKQNIYGIVGVAAHDKDKEVLQLRRGLSSVRKTDWDVELQEAARLIIVSSDIPEIELFKDSVKKREWIIEYDFDTTSAAQLSDLIKKKAKELNPKTLAFANHGMNDEGHWGITHDLWIDVCAEKLEPKAKEFFKIVADACQTRVDLLACELAGSEEGLALIRQLENITGKNFAASTNHTGNLAVGADWVMETDNVDTGVIYFETQKLIAWQGHLSSSSGQAAASKGRRRR